jgi:hypothetical protein
MKTRPLAVSGLALSLLALAACQRAAPTREAKLASAPIDPAVATAVNEVRSAAIDPATGRPRDLGVAFAPPGAPPVVAPPNTLGGHEAIALDPTAVDPALGMRPATGN